MPRGAHAYLRYSDEIDVREPEQAEQARPRLRNAARGALPALVNLPADRVGAMTDDEVLVRYVVHMKMELDHQTAAVLGLKPREAALELRKLDAAATRYAADTGLQIDVARTRSVYVRLWSVNRRIQALRIVEAVRDYAAAHDGKLPEQLSDISHVPVPIDPLSDQPFEWTLDREANTATLKAPPISSDFGDTSHATVEYRLRVR